MSDELKPLPCPFCGSERVTVEAGDGFKWRVAGCCACGALAGEVRLNTFMVDRAAAEAEATRRAIEEWNARSDDTLRTQLAAEKEARESHADDAARLHREKCECLTREMALTAERDVLAVELDAVLAAYTALRCKGSFNVTASDWIAFDAVVRPVVLAADKRAGKPPFDPSPDEVALEKHLAPLAAYQRFQMTDRPHVAARPFEMRICDDCGMTHQATVLNGETLKPGTPCFRCGSTTGYRVAT